MIHCSAFISLMMKKLLDHLVLLFPQFSEFKHLLMGHFKEQNVGYIFLLLFLSKLTASVSRFR